MIALSGVFTIYTFKRASKGYCLNSFNQRPYAEHRGIRLIKIVQI